MRPANTNDLPAVLGLLTNNALPTAGVKEHLHNFVLEFENDHAVGCAGLEIHGQAGLLRSVVVAQNHRSRGLGKQLVQAMLNEARKRGLLHVALLTETASIYFPRFGFQISPRNALPKALHASQEFQGACAQTATAMLLELPSEH